MTPNLYDYRRCSFRSTEYQRLIADGWVLVCVSSLNIALLQREKA